MVTNDKKDDNKFDEKPSNESNYLKRLQKKAKTMGILSMMNFADILSTKNLPDDSVLKYIPEPNNFLDTLNFNTDKQNLKNIVDNYVGYSSDDLSNISKDFVDNDVSKRQSVGNAIMALYDLNETAKIDLILKENNYDSLSCRNAIHQIDVFTTPGARVSFSLSSDKKTDSKESILIEKPKDTCNICLDINHLNRPFFDYKKNEGEKSYRSDIVQKDSINKKQEFEDVQDAYSNKLLNLDSNMYNEKGKIMPDSISKKSLHLTEGIFHKHTSTEEQLKHEISSLKPAVLVALPQKMQEVYFQAVNNYFDLQK